MLRQGMDAPRCKVGILGMTFKENCPDIRNSKVIDMVREFQSWGMQVVVSDPVADADEVLRLKQISGLTELFADESFSEAWTVE